MSDEKTHKQGKSFDLQELVDRLRAISPSVLTDARAVAEKMTEKGMTTPKAVDLRTESFSPKPTPAVTDQADSAAKGKLLHIKSAEQENLIQHAASGYGSKAAEQKTEKGVGDKVVAREGTKKQGNALSTATTTPAELASQLRGHAKNAETVSRSELGNTSPGQTPVAKAPAKSQSKPGPAKEGPSR